MISQLQLNVITFLLWEGNLHQNLLLWLSVHLGLICLRLAAAGLAEGCSAPPATGAAAGKSLSGYGHRG